MRIIWLLGCRSGSNWLGSKIEAAGAFVPQDRLEPNSWNPQWVEGHILNRLSCNLLGVEDHFFIARQERPAKFQASSDLYELEGYIRSHARQARSAPLLLKFGSLPYLWPEIELMVSDIDQVLVIASRDRTSRITSLLRVHEEYRPCRTFEQAEDFFNRHDAGVRQLAEKFDASGRNIWNIDFGKDLPENLNKFIILNGQAAFKPSLASFGS